jgi:hypothetical protein
MWYWGSDLELKAYFNFGASRSIVTSTLHESILELYYF